MLKGLMSDLEKYLMEDGVCKNECPRAWELLNWSMTALLSAKEQGNSAAVAALRKLFYHRNPLGIKIEEQVAEQDHELWQTIYNLLSQPPCPAGRTTPASVQCQSCKYKDKCDGDCALKRLIDAGILKPAQRT